MNGYQDSTKCKCQKLCQPEDVEESQLTSDTARRPRDDTSRFNQLPRDTLAEIFVQCLPEVWLWPSISGRSSKDVAPLLLCNVCSTWRAVALAIPRLWQTLVLVFGEAMPKSKLKEEAIAMTHIWIRRSGVLPLTLRLWVQQFRAGEDLGEALLNALFTYASRWEHFETNLPIRSTQLEHLPCLRTLGVSADESTQFPFASCPKLTRIHWLFESTVSSTALPWHQLTHIDLDHATSTRDIIFVIRSCPKLTELDVALEDEVQELLPREIVVSKSLWKLRVFHTCNSLLKRLALPALTDIAIELEYDSDVTSGFQKDLLDFFSRSKCKLNRMHLENCRFNDEELLECLKHESCTALMDLSAYNSPIFTDSVLLALTDLRSAENKLLLPKLARLSLELCLGGSPSRLRIMVLSRCISQGNAVQLRFLRIDCTDLDDRDIDLLRLAEIQSPGLEVSLDFPDSEW